MKAIYFRDSDYHFPFMLYLQQLKRNGKAAKKKGDFQTYKKLGAQYAILITFITQIKQFSINQFNDALQLSCNPFYAYAIENEPPIQFDGYQITKKLNNFQRNSPIWELRVNISSQKWSSININAIAWIFRVTFFLYNYNDTGYECYLYAFTKNPKRHDNGNKITDTNARNALQIYKNVQKNFDSYKNIFLDYKYEII